MVEIARIKKILKIEMFLFHLTHSTLAQPHLRRSYVDFNFEKYFFTFGRSDATPRMAAFARSRISQNLDLADFFFISEIDSPWRKEAPVKFL